jgi:hypothetical protein
MKLKIALTVDPDAGEQLVGLLVKAFGRGELGIVDLKIDRAGYEKPLGPVRQSTIAKLVARREHGPKRYRKGYELGMRAMKSGKPNGVTVTLKALKHNLSREGFREMWREHGLAPNGLSATLSRLQRRGYVQGDGAGVWKLTPKGEELEAKLNAKVEHDDRKSD